MINKLKQALISRKLWAAVVGALILAVGGHFGMDEETLTKIAGIVAAYIVGQGLADAGKEKAGAEARAQAEVAVAGVDDPTERARLLAELGGD